jgi:hypothetical protein
MIFPTNILNMRHIHMGYIVVHKKNLKCLLYTEENVADKNFKITNIRMTNTKPLLFTVSLGIKDKVVRGYRTYHVQVRS